MNLVCGICIMWNICCMWLLLSCFTNAEIAESQAGNGTKMSNSNTTVSKNITITTEKSIAMPIEGGGSVVSTVLPKKYIADNITLQGKVSDGLPEKKNDTQVQSQLETSTKNNITHAPREGVEIKPKTEKTTVTSAKTISAVTNVTNSVGVILANTTAINKTVANSTHNEVKPVYEYEQGEKNDGKPSVPKKAPKMDEPIDVPQITSTVMPDSTKSKEKPKKPLITEATDDFLPSHFISNNKLEVSNKENSNVPSLEKVEQRQHRSANYVVPIVAVILSVPLVAIIISVFYKRTSEWWHHRHYRRMDFLIEGMYNN